MTVTTSKKFNPHQKLNSRERIMFLVMLLVGSGGFLKSCVMASNAVIKESEQKLSDLDAEKKRLEQIVTAAQSAEPTSPVASNSKNWTASSADLASAADAILQSFRLKNLRLSKSVISDVTANKDNSSLFQRDVTLQVDGTLSRVGAYLAYLENMPAPLVINQFSLQPTKDQPEMVRLDITGGVYATK